MAAVCVGCGGTDGIEGLDEAAGPGAVVGCRACWEAFAAAFLLEEGAGAELVDGGISVPDGPATRLADALLAAAARERLH